MKIYGKYKYIYLVIILLFIGGVIYYVLDSSFGYFSNISSVRTIISNVSTFFYDRGSYIQYDASYMDKNGTVKRNNGYYYPEDATLDNTIYMDNISFIANVFYAGLNYDIKNTFEDLTMDGIKNYGNGIYSKAVLEDDTRVNSTFIDSEDNSYVIDFYDNTVTKTTASMGNSDKHILTMYVNNDYIDKDIDRNNIYNKLLDTLYVGDIIVYKDYVLLYVGTDTFIYCSGEDYDYDNSKDYVEDRAIKYGSMEELNDSFSDKYLFSGDSFYVFRIGNNYGTWTIPKYINSISSYFNNSIIVDTVPKIRIEKYGNVSRSNDVYEGEDITYTIRITNNTNEGIVIPSISDVIGSNVVYVSNNYSEESYVNNQLLFENIEIDGNSYRDISYMVRVLDSEGVVISDSTKIGEYTINNISYTIGNLMNRNKIIDSYASYLDISSLYGDLYGTELDFMDIWSNIVDENGMYKDGYSLLVKGLYGGTYISTNSDLIVDRCRYVEENNLVTGDIVIYNDGYVDNYLLYVDTDYNSFFVNYGDNVSINMDVDRVLESLLGMNRFMIIRPSYMYEDRKIDFGNLDVDYQYNLLKFKDSITYQDVINEISGYEIILIKDIDDNLLSTDVMIRSGDMIIINNTDIYYISLLGDITGDGYVDTSDVLKLHRYILGKASISDRWYIESCYINSDDEIDTADVLKLHRYVLGKIESLG